MKKLIVTGGAGFIGSAVVRLAVSSGYEVFNLDALTYCASLANVESIKEASNYHFCYGDIRDKEFVFQLFDNIKPDGVIHLAAESHVDKSIDGPNDFIQTNIIGTFNLLEAARDYLSRHPNSDAFRFLHVSTDEVFGSLGDVGLFTESSPYKPNSPYSASKAASDHLVRAWHETYDLPIVLTNCSNNYGPFQFPEKLIPKLIFNAMEQQPLTIYGTGDNVRDWLFVEDHAKALLCVLNEGKVSRSYNIGGNNEATNLSIVNKICSIMDEVFPHRQPHSQLITFVADRPGHDYRYAIDSSRIKEELGWQPMISLDEGLERTVKWYIEMENYLEVTSQEPMTFFTTGAG